jgi:type IV pilus assembly protein PilV
MSIAKHSSRAQRGFTLIEILVTVVLISVGLLGVAALQLTTLRSNQESYVRSQASVLASDILDRIRANPLQFREEAYDADFDELGEAGTQANRDLAEWQDTIDRILPGGAAIAAGRVLRFENAATRRHVVEITIRWVERPQGDGSPIDNENGMRTFQLRSEI